MLMSLIIILLYIEHVDNPEKILIVEMIYLIHAFLLCSDKLIIFKPLPDHTKRYLGIWTLSHQKV